MKSLGDADLRLEAFLHSVIWVVTSDAKKKINTNVFFFFRIASLVVTRPQHISLSPPLMLSQIEWITAFFFRNRRQSNLLSESVTRTDMSRLPVLELIST